MELYKFFRFSFFIARKSRPTKRNTPSSVVKNRLAGKQSSAGATRRRSNRASTV
jgi:hypothetical protein